MKRNETIINPSNPYGIAENEEVEEALVNERVSGCGCRGGSSGAPAVSNPRNDDDRQRTGHSYRSFRAPLSHTQNQRSATWSGCHFWDFSQWDTLRLFVNLSLPSSRYTITGSLRCTNCTFIPLAYYLHLNHKSPCTHSYPYFYLFEGVFSLVTCSVQVASATLLREA